MATENNDTISSDGTGERIDGRGGDDSLIGNGGNDQLYGGAGNDTLYGDEAPGEPTVLISTQFERSAEGWTWSEGAGNLTYRTGGGNSPEEYPTTSDGAIRGADSVGGAAYYIAPSAYHGDLSDAVGGTLSFDVYADLNGTSTGTPNNLGAGVRITGTNSLGQTVTIVYNQPLSATEETWVTNDITLTAANFGVSEADFEAIMSSVTDLRILGEYYSGTAGNDASQLDNIVLSAPADTVTTSSADNLNAQTGDDVIYGGDGNDVLIGGVGTDTLEGGDGNDTIYGEGNRQILNATSYFDNSNEGWTTSQSQGGAETSATYLETGAVSGSGGIQFSDTAGGTGYFHSNENFEGDQSSVYGGSLSFRQYLDLNGGAYNNTGQPQIVIIGAGGTLTYRGEVDQASASSAPTWEPYTLTDGAWTTVNATITEGNWLIDGRVATEAEIKAVLADISDILIQAEYTSGAGDGSRLDNVELKANPSLVADDVNVSTTDSYDDVIDGGTGDDVVYAGAGNDVVTDSGTTSDTIYGQGGNDSLDGGLGDDTVSGGSGQDTVYGGEGNDYLTGGAGDDTVEGGIGNDTIVGNTDIGGQYTLGTGQVYMYGTNFVQGDSSDPYLNSEHNYDSFLVTGGPIGASFVDDDPNADGDTATEEVSDDADQRIIINGVSYSYFMEEVAVYVDGDVVTDINIGDYDTLEELQAELDQNGYDYYIFADLDIDVFGTNGTPASYLEDGSVKVLLSSSTGAPPPADTDLKNVLVITQDAIPYNTPEGNDSLVGGEGDDSILGDGGNDTLDGGAGSDILDGGAGDDAIAVGSGDTASGGDDRDTFTLDASQFDPLNPTITIDGGAGGTDGDKALDFDSIVFGPGVNFVPGSLSATDDGDALAPSRSGSFRVEVDGVEYTVNFTEIESLTCFARGTLIETDAGDIAIENLRVGDRVRTKDNDFKEIRWIGSRSLIRGKDSKIEKFAPILIKAGALASGRPAKDLYVSPQHRILINSRIAERMFGAREVLVAAKQLQAIEGIKQVTDFEMVQYFHFLLDQHEVVFSNGCETESLFTGPEALKSVDPEAAEEILTLFPELENDITPEPSRLLPKGRLGRKLASRHQKNGVALQC